MRIEWYGQSAFRLSGAERSVVIDPFGDLGAATGGRRRFGYPPVDPAGADLVLITHEHLDHNEAAAVGGSPVVLRSTAGRHASPLGEIVGIASEHDPLAGTDRGPNTIFSFELDGVRIAHFGDFGQRELRDEQAAALEGVELLFLPIGGPPTIGAEQAAAIATRLRARWVIPMHYRTPRIDFLEGPEAFLERMPGLRKFPSSAFELPERGADAAQPLVLLPAVP